MRTYPFFLHSIIAEYQAEEKVINDLKDGDILNTVKGGARWQASISA